MTTRDALDAEARASAEGLARRGLARAPTGTDGLVDLVTNDYLGLRRDPRVVAAASAALSRAGLGTGGSRLLAGDDPEHRALEDAVARWLGEEAAVCFPTGSAANAGTLTALLRPGDVAVSDEWNHGSLVDGIRLSGASKAVVPHGDVSAVEAALAKAPAAGRRFVVFESIHGMEGDVAPLEALADVCRRREALLVVDEAHAAGLVGPDGAGLVAEVGCADVVAARVVPCGKALGGAGGVVACSKAVASLLHHVSRQFTYATALPPAVAAGVRAALGVGRAEPWRRERSRALARRTFEALTALGERAHALPPAGGFVAWILGPPEAALLAAERFRARGFAVRAVRPPTVPEGTSRVRLSLHADLSDADVERFLAALPEVARGLPR